MARHNAGAKESPLNVAIVTGPFPVLSETFVVDQAMALTELGHRVTVLAFGGKPPEEELYSTAYADSNLMQAVEYTAENSAGRSSLTAARIRTLVDNITTDYRGTFSVLSELLFKYGDSRCVRFMESSTLIQRKATEFDVIHAQFGTIARRLLAYRRLRLISGPIITHFRGADITSFVKRKGKDIYGELFRHGDYFFSNCDYFRLLAIELGCDPSKIDVLPTGVNLDSFKFKTRRKVSKDNIRLLAVGRLVEKKGFEFAIRAVAKLLDEGRNLSLEIVGDGDLRPHLEAIIRDLGIGDNVRLRGKVDPSLIPDALDGADIFIAPSVTAQNGDEDAPVNTLKEALATGLPVVSTYHGGIPELVEHNETGFLVGERDASALADAIGTSIDNYDYALDLARAGRARVETTYDLRRVEAKMVERYRQVAEQRRGSQP